MLQVECSFENILMYGRYIKLSREVSQTPWSVDGGRTTLEGNVQDHLADGIKQEYFGTDTVMLHGSGREDIDVRMLGRGRPFIMEFVNPKKGVSCH